MRFLGLFACLCISACGSSESSPAAPATGTDAGADVAADAPPVVAGLDYLIIAADPLMKSAQRFADFRKSTGQFVELTAASTLVAGKNQLEASKAIQAHVKARYEARDPAKAFYVLIVGDADEGVTNDTVPAAAWNDPETSLAVTTDNVYADMNGDDIPDLALGRIPARTDEEVDRVLAKVRAYESTYTVGAWNRRLNIFASTSGFGEPADTLIEQLVFNIVEEIPYEYDLTMTYARKDSPYVFVPEKFSDKVYERISEGALMVTYVGHGFKDGFATLDWSGRSFPILDTSQLSKITASAKMPILTLIACATGAFDEGESISEKILKSPTGPVAVLSSTEDSQPYPNAIFVRELGQVMALTREPTLGLAFVSAKKRMIDNADALRVMIDQRAGGLLMPAVRASQKKSHLYMYTLFGDPAMRIAYPGKGALTAPATAAPGATFDVTATLTGLGEGRALVTLETARTKIPGAITPVPADGDATRDTVIAENYAVANDKVVAKVDATFTTGSLVTTVTVPSDLPAGDYQLKVYAEDGKKDLALAVRVVVKP